jgi:hypothetical protein
MQPAVIVLGLAALGGATLVIIRLRGAPLPPTLLAVGHGLIAATGVGLLIYAAATAGIPTLAQVALGVFILAALGGIFIFANYHRRGRPLPIPLILGHGVLAIAGYALLLYAYFQPA